MRMRLATGSCRCFDVNYLRFARREFAPRGVNFAYFRKMPEAGCGGSADGANCGNDQRKILKRLLQRAAQAFKYRPSIPVDRKIDALSQAMVPENLVFYVF